jgi:hypothetical protein
VRRLRQELARVPSGIRRLAFASLALGISAITASTWLDFQGDAWDNLPFVTNVVSSGSTALIGIAFVLLVFTHLSDNVARHIERQAVLELAAKACVGLSRAVWKAFGPDEYDIRYDATGNYLSDFVKNMESNFTMYGAQVRRC